MNTKNNKIKPAATKTVVLTINKIISGCKIQNKLYLNKYNKKLTRLIIVNFHKVVEKFFGGLFQTSPNKNLLHTFITRSSEWLILFFFTKNFQPTITKTK